MEFALYFFIYFEKKTNRISLRTNNKVHSVHYTYICHNKIIIKS